MSKVMRSVKNVTKGYSTVQVKVRDATSNDPWGPTGTQMQEISQMTYNSSTEFYEIMDMIDKRLNDKGKNWRHVLKALKVLDYILHEGSEMVVTWARKNLFIIKTLREFQHIDDDGRDVGQNVRVSAKELTSLILDEERLKAERNDRKTWKSRVTGIEEFSGRGDDMSPPPVRRAPRQQRAQRADEEDAEYKLAIEASKYQEEEDRKKRASRQGEPMDEDLAKAIKLSKEEEELRRRELEQQNAASLFDDNPVQTNQPAFTGHNQGYQQQAAVDWSGNPVGMNQQPTGYYDPNQQQYSQQHQTGYQNGFQPQPTGFDPYGAGSFGQQQQQPQQQNNQFLGTQPTGYNPYAQQMQQPQQSQQHLSPEPQIPANTNNPWATSNQNQHLQPMPTGSNNPFAKPQSSRPTTASSYSQPTLSTLSEQKTMSQFNNNFNPPTSFTPPPSGQQKQQTAYQSKLSDLLESGDGMDTFGNTGNLRIPAQHTAPGTFVNSAGSQMDKMRMQQTGSNPFMNQQFTGMPQQQFPAQTGPAGFQQHGFGQQQQQQSNNPFGPRPGQQQNGGANLIDF